MRILVLNADYPRFLAWLYRRNAGLENASYAAQMEARNASLFGLANFYSRNFEALRPPRRRNSSQQSRLAVRVGARARHCG